MHLTVHGARGSTAVSDPASLRYGGNTTCFEVAVDEKRRLLIDCGSGLRTMQRTLPSDTGLSLVVLMTHYHWDHISGLPFFPPLWTEGNEFRIIGAEAEGGVGAAVCIGQAIQPPWFPVSMAESPATITYETADGAIDVWGIGVTSRPLNHPQGVVAYRIEGPTRSIVIATDHEAGTDADAVLVELARDADVLVHDAQYTPEEYRNDKVGWGHSTWEHAAQIAEAAGVRRLVLTSHDPDRTDAEIDVIVNRARARFPDTDAAREGMELAL